MALKVRIIATDSLSGTLRNVGARVVNLGIQFVKFGVIAATAIAGVSIKLAKDMDKGLREIGTLMGGLTNVQMKNMSDELMRIASTSGQAMNALTKAKYDIVSAGFTNAANSAIVLKQSAVIAVGGVTDMATAADLLTTALNAYNKSASESSDVSDILFTTVRLGKTTMTELGGSMGRLLAIAGQMDISLVEVGAALATLTAGGQDTAEATTAIRASIVQLMQPQTDLAKLIEGTSYKTTLALLASEGYAGALRVIKEEANKAGVPMTDLFNNVRAMQAVLPLTGIAAQKFGENLLEFEKRAGSAQGAYDEMQKSFAVVTARLQQNVNNMLISLGTRLIAKLQPKIDNFNKTMEGMGALNWDKLFNIIAENWGKILLSLGKLTLVGGKIIGAQLMHGLDNAFRGGAFMKTIEFITDVLDAFALAFSWLIQDMNLFRKTLEAINYDQFTESTEGYKESLKGLKKEFGGVVSEIIGGFIPAFENIQELVEETSETIDNAISTVVDVEGLQAKLDSATDAYQKQADEIEAIELTKLEKARMMTDAVGDLYTNLSGLIKQSIQNQLDEQIRAVLASTASEEEKEAKISNLREKARQKEIAALKKLKVIKLAMAVSDTALAITGALAMKPPSPFNLVLAGIMAAAGAAQIATIAASPYAQGGFVRMGGNIPSSDTIPAMLSPREIVSTPAASERFGAEIQRLNQIADGGGFGGGGSNYYINAIDSQSFLDAIRRQPEKFAEAMQLVRSERYL